MQLEAIYHRIKNNWIYAYDERTLHIRLRTKKEDADAAYVIAGDKYDWEETSSRHLMSKVGTDLLFDYWQAEVQPPHKRLVYGFELHSGDELLWFTENGFPGKKPEGFEGFFEFPYLHPGDALRPPSWVKESVFYQIMLDRFANGDRSNDPKQVQPWGGKPEVDSFFGGDLQGVINRLDYLSELGVNAIYFTPIFEAYTYHKYDTVDYRKVDHHFGTIETLKNLVKACHDRGIRVVLDAVFNHSGEGFPPFQDLKNRGQASEYSDWFHIKEWPITVKDGKPSYEAFGFDGTLPKLRTDHPEVRKYLYDTVRMWMEETGIDGWRLDVANEVDHRFWRGFRDLVKDLNPDAYILGEVWTDARVWLQGDQFDAAMNYPFMYAIHKFVTGETDGAHFAQSLTTNLMGHQLHVNEVAFNLLGSHDTARILTVCGEDSRKQMLAAAVLFTYMGTPCVYYGDEIGLTGENDPDCRKCMEWQIEKQDRELFRFYQKLISIRKNEPALRDGSISFLQYKEKDKTVVYERRSGGERIAVILNGDEKTDVYVMQCGQNKWTDLMTGDVLTASNGVLNLTLAPYGFYILKESE